MTDRNSEVVSIEMLPLPEVDATIDLLDHSVSFRSARPLLGSHVDVYYAPTLDEYRAVAEHNVKALREEVSRLQEAVRPKREEACLTLDNWRMRAYDLENNWSRSSRAANDEAERRKGAEARAERLAEVLREVRNFIEDGSYEAMIIDDALRDHDQEGGDA